MKIKLTFLLAIISIVIKSQSLEGFYDGKEVRLFWFPDIENYDYTGFILKRKSKNIGLINLTETPLIPSYSINKDISNVSNSGIIIKLLDSLKIEYNKPESAISLTDISKERYIEILNNNEEKKAISTLLTYNYNIALLHGFAFIDSLPQSENHFEYLLYAITKDDNEELMGKYIIDKNLLSEFNLPLKSEMKIFGDKIYLTWKFDYIKYSENKFISGFNIYLKDGEILKKLNNNIMWCSKPVSDTAIISYTINKKTLQNNNSLVVLKPTTIFNTELKGDSIEIIKDCNYQILLSQIKKNNDSIFIKWKISFDKLQCVKSINLLFSENYPIEELKLLENFKTTDSIYSFLPEKFSEKKRLYFQIESNNYFGDKILSNILYVDYQRKSIPPNNLNCYLEKKIDNDFYVFTWKENPNPTIYKLYKIYNNKEILIGSIADSLTFSYPIYISLSSDVKFAISATEIGKIESEKAFFQLPQIKSSFLEMPYLESAERIGDSILIKWKYPNIYNDLLGFKIYNKNEVIKITKTENETIKIPANIEEDYQISISAFNNNIESEKSAIIIVKK